MRFDLVERGIGGKVLATFTDTYHPASWDHVWVVVEGDWYTVEYRTFFATENRWEIYCEGPFPHPLAYREHK